MFLKGKDAGENQQRARLIAYKTTFGDDSGKEVLIDLVNRFHVYNPNPGRDDWERAVAEGQRQVVLHIIGQSGASIEAFDKLLKGENPYVDINSE